LDDLVQNKVFLTNRDEETLDEVRGSIQYALENYCPEQDIIVPVGRTLLSFIIAIELMKEHDQIQVAIYRGHTYTVVDLLSPHGLFGLPNRFERIS
jgi:hypothetical protein